MAKRELCSFRGDSTLPGYLFISTADSGGRRRPGDRFLTLPSRDRCGRARLRARRRRHARRPRCGRVREHRRRRPPRRGHTDGVLRPRGHTPRRRCVLRLDAEWDWFVTLHAALCISSAWTTAALCISSTSLARSQGQMPERRRCACWPAEKNRCC